MCDCGVFLLLDKMILFLSPGSSEQHGSSSTTNMNVNVISPEKVSSSTRRRYETQVCDTHTHNTAT